MNSNNYWNYGPCYNEQIKSLKVWFFFFFFPFPHLEDGCSNLIIKSNNKFNYKSRKELKKMPRVDGRDKSFFFSLPPPSRLFFSRSSVSEQEVAPRRGSSSCFPISPSSVSRVFIEPDSGSIDDKDVRLPLKRRTAGVRGLHGWRTPAHLSPHHTNNRPSRRTMADVPPPPQLRFHFS